MFLDQALWSGTNWTSRPVTFLVGTAGELKTIVGSFEACEFTIKIGEVTTTDQQFGSSELVFEFTGFDFECPVSTLSQFTLFK